MSVQPTVAPLNIPILVNVCVRLSGVVLHEEHIELLTEDYKELKKAVDGKVLQEGSLHFTGEKQKCVVTEVCCACMKTNKK